MFVIYLGAIHTGLSFFKIILLFKTFFTENFIKLWKPPQTLSKKQICKEYQAGTCTKPVLECTQAHPPAHCPVDTENSLVIVCVDFVKGKCSRDTCKYFHPPEHLVAQLKKQKLSNNALVAAAQAVQQQQQATVVAALNFLPINANPNSHLITFNQAIQAQHAHSVLYQRHLNMNHNQHRASVHYSNLYGPSFGNRHYQNINSPTLHTTGLDLILNRNGASSIGSTTSSNSSSFSSTANSIQTSSASNSASSTTNPIYNKFLENYTDNNTLIYALAAAASACTTSCTHSTSSSGTVPSSSSTNVSNNLVGKKFL